MEEKEEEEETREKEKERWLIDVLKYFFFRSHTFISISSLVGTNAKLDYRLDSLSEVA